MAKKPDLETHGFRRVSLTVGANPVLVIYICERVVFDEFKLIDLSKAQIIEIGGPPGTAADDVSIGPALADAAAASDDHIDTVANIASARQGSRKKNCSA